MGWTNAPESCGDEIQKICASDEAPFDEVTINWQGDCAFTDDRAFFLEVFPAQDASGSCEPYTFTLEHLENVPQPETRTF